MKTLEQEVLELADYLGANGPEMWHELEPMFKEQRLTAIDKAIEHFQNIPLDRVMPDPGSPKNSAIMELREVRKELDRG